MLAAFLANPRKIEFVSGGIDWPRTLLKSYAPQFDGEWEFVPKVTSLEGLPQLKRLAEVSLSAEISDFGPLEELST